MAEKFEFPEKPDSRKERIVGLIIAAIAVILAIVSSLGHQAHDEEILAHVDAADQYSFYQAKKDRHAQLDLATDNLRVQNDRLSPEAKVQAAQLLAGYADEIKHLESAAVEIHANGDDLMKKSRLLATKASVLDLGEIALQIAVVLCSITILTDQNLFVRMGVSIAAVGILVALWGVFLPG